MTFEPIGNLTADAEIGRLIWKFELGQTSDIFHNVGLSVIAHLGKTD